VQPDSNLDDEMLEQEKCEVAAKLDAQGTLEGSAAGSIDGDWSGKWRSSRARFEDTLAEVKSAICDRAQLVSRGSKWIALKNSAILGGAGKLRVRLIQCTALPRMDLGSLCDCFCRIHVDELKVSESKVVEECIDPVFDETFDFYVTNCASQTLKIEFLDKDDLEEEALEQQQKQFLREGAPTNKRSINAADLTTSMETATAMAAKMMEEDR
jgi:Ca2+-dependent lipid-binding protein